MPSTLEMICPPHSFRLDHRVLPGKALAVEIDGAIQDVPVSAVFAHCPECGLYLEAAQITQILNGIVIPQEEE